MTATDPTTRQAATGVHFPADDSGARSSGSLAREVLTDALATVDSRAADRARATREWRKNYLGPFTDLVRAGVADAAAWNGVARTALESLQSRMVAIHDGAEIPVREFLPAARPRFEFETETLRGTAARQEELRIPYQGTELSGEALRHQLDDWVGRGIIEPSCAEAVRRVQDHPEWLSLPGRSVLVLGLGSEMGPARTLLRWGATVVGVDLPGSPVWDRLREEIPSTAGTLHLPLAHGTPGADLLNQLPEIAAWSSRASENPLTVGNYVYADGGTHVRLSSATDALATHLLDNRAADALAFLATPMDTYVVPPEVREQANSAFEARQKGLDVRTIAGRLTGHKLFHRNYDAGSGPGIHDALVPQQGPNYTLAKRIQRWRATAASAEDHEVSITVAPSTNTRSVTKNKALAFAYRGAPVFGIEVLEPETSSALLAALLVHDLNSAPPRPEVQWMEESRAAASGGLWRQPYQPRTALTVAAAIGTVKR